MGRSRRRVGRQVGVRRMRACRVLAARGRDERRASGLEFGPSFCVREWQSGFVSGADEALPLHSVLRVSVAHARSRVSACLPACRTCDDLDRI